MTHSGAIKWVINVEDPSDVRGYDPNGNVVHWLNTGGDLKLLCKITNLCDSTGYSVAILPKKPPITQNSKLMQEFYKAPK